MLIYRSISDRKCDEIDELIFIKKYKFKNNCFPYLHLEWERVFKFMKFKRIIYNNIYRM